MKTAIRIIVLFLVVGAAGFAGYYVLNGIKLPTFPEVEQIVPFQVGGGPSGNIGERPTEQSGGESAETIGESGNLLEKVSHGAVFSYSVISDSEIYYFTTDGRVFRIRIDGDEVISDKTLASLNGVWTTGDGKRALVSFGDPNDPEWGVFDFLDGAWRPLPASIAYAAWGENTDTLIAIEEADGQRNLVRVNLTKGTPVSSLIFKNFGVRDISFINAGKDSVFIVEKSSSFYKSSIWKLNVKTLEMVAVFPEEYGLLIENLPNLAGWITFSSPNKLSLATIGGAIRKQFILNTLPEKCGGAGNRFFCFVPTNILENIFLPDDYFKNKISFTDALYQINPDNGEEKVLFQSGAENIPAIDGKNVSLIGERIYFINKHDKGLYRINLTLVGRNEKPVE